MNKKTLRIITIIATALAVIFMSSFVFALAPNSVTITEPQNGDVQTVGGKIMGFIQVIGVIISVGILMILGIKYMIGSIEERAEYKKSMLPILIGMILLFGTSTVLNIINNVING